MCSSSGPSGPNDKRETVSDLASRTATPPEWFRDAFRGVYRELYAHRDDTEARAAIDLLLRAAPSLAAAPKMTPKMTPNEARPPQFQPAIEAARPHSPQQFPARPATDAAPAASRLLDLCCGAGRHAIEARSRGLDVVGFDLSDDLLGAARDDAAELPLVRGDMRALPFADGAFDAVINLFTSFGYFDDPADDDRVAAEIARVLRPGGVLLWDHIAPDWLRANLEPRSERLLSDGTRVVERREIDEARGRVLKFVEIADGGTGARLKYLESVRLFGPGEAAALFGRAGLAVEARFGDYSATTTSGENNSPRQILLLRKSV